MTRSITGAQLVDGNRSDRVAASLEWIPFARYAISGLTVLNWSVIAEVDCDVDQGVTGEVRLRLGTGTISTAATITGPVTNVLLGFEQFITPATYVAQTLILVEGRRTAGTTGGLHVRRHAVSVMSEPPAALVGGPHFTGPTISTGLYPPDYSGYT